MPISPVLAYASTSHGANLNLGDKTTEGFVRICQTGDNSVREGELKSNMKTISVAKGAGLIFPGQTEEIILRAPKNNIGSINVETMYGKTKDVCGVINIDGQDLSKLHHNVVSSVSGSDSVVASGAFTDPSAENAAELCADAADGVSCLRKLSEQGNGIVRAFPGYLPSVLSFIEKEYGAKDAQTLLVPTSGAIRFTLSLKK